MNELFSNTTNFASLSLKDLLTARSLFSLSPAKQKKCRGNRCGSLPDPKKQIHGRIISIPTQNQRKKASGHFLIRKSDPIPGHVFMFFVYNWMEEEKLSAVNPSDVVPKTLYLPDGRTVPVCVIEAQKQLYSDNLKVNMQSLFPRNVLMPGSPIINPDAQGLPRVATVGGIVKRW